MSKGLAATATLDVGRRSRDRSDTRRFRIAIRRGRCTILDARAEEELRRAEEREGDASQRYEAAIGALREALLPVQTALGELVREHDPRRIIMELVREAGDAEREIEARRTGRVFGRNTTAELLFLERPGLFPALVTLTEWQDALIACLPPEEEEGHHQEVDPAQQAQTEPDPSQSV